MEGPRLLLESLLHSHESHHVTSRVVSYAYASAAGHKSQTESMPALQHYPFLKICAQGQSHSLRLTFHLCTGIRARARIVSKKKLVEP